ncbi:serine hydrolase domain-containing protein [Arthrobacter pigmenti]
MTEPAAAELQVELERLLSGAVSKGVTPSVVCAVALNGRIYEPIAVGDAVRFGEDGMELSPAMRTPVTPDTLYDLASVTKIFTAVTVLTLVEEGLLGLDDPISNWLAPYRSGVKTKVTLRQLLTHTSGLPSIWQGWRARPLRDRPQLVNELVEMDLEAIPGTKFSYSCVGFNTLMALAEQVTGACWSEVVQARVLGPLARADPGAINLIYAPEAQECAATEYQREFGRAMVRGAVHDESAFALGGAAGNAGLFGTARALLGFGEWLRGGARSPTETSSPFGKPLLSEPLMSELWRDQLPGVLGAGAEFASPSYGQGLGLRIGEMAWMGKGGISARGHNGFTGTSLLMDNEAGLSIVLLTNRVHPTRTNSDVQLLRAAVANTTYSANRTS